MGRTSSDRSKSRDASGRSSSSRKHHSHHQRHSDHHSDRGDRSHHHQHRQHSEKSSERSQHHQRQSSSSHRHRRNDSDSESGIDCPPPAHHSSSSRKQSLPPPIRERVYSPHEQQQRQRHSSRPSSSSHIDESRPRSGYDNHHSRHVTIEPENNKRSSSHYNPYSEHDDRTYDDEVDDDNDPSPHRHHQRSKSPPRNRYVEEREDDYPFDYYLQNHHPYAVQQHHQYPPPLLNARIGPIYHNGQRGGFQQRQPPPLIGYDQFNYHHASDEYMMRPGGPSMPIKTQINQMLHPQHHHHQQLPLNSNNVTFNAQGVEVETQPRMLSLREFTSTHLDLNDPTNKYESGRMSKYNQYRETFRAEQIRCFFDAHKHDDWFRARYHPDEAGRRSAELGQVYKRRLSVFRRVADRYLSGVELCAGGEDDDDDQKLRLGLYRFMDACQVALEGGGDTELDELDSIYSPPSSQKRKRREEGHGSRSKKSREDNEAGEDEEEPEEGEEPDIPVPPPPSSSSIGGVPVSISAAANPLTPSIPKKTQSIFFKHLPCHVTKADVEKIGKQFEGFKRAAISEPAPDRGFQRRAWLTFDAASIKLSINEISAQIGKMKINESVNLSVQVNREVNQKCKLINGLANHAQIVRHDLRLAATIVEVMDKKWSTWCETSTNPYLVEALEYLDSLSTTQRPTTSNETQDSLPSPLNQQESQSELEDADKTEKATEAIELEASSNSPPTTATYQDLCKEDEDEKQVAVVTTQESYTTTNNGGSTQDVLLLLNEDEQFDLDTSELVSTQNEESVKESSSKDVNGSNHLDSSQYPCTCGLVHIKFELDPTATRLLDQLILYLRIVYSIDFYKATEYLQEDAMPYRCGLLHIRAYQKKQYSSQHNHHFEQVSILPGEHIKFGFDPTNVLRQTEVDEWCTLFESHVRHLTDPSRVTMDQETAKRLGLRDAQTEVAEFIRANTHQESQDVWICLLSDKKFRGADYVRKHIETKFGQHLEEIRNECNFFNRYLLDPKRPYLPENPLNRNDGGHSGAYGPRNNSGMASLMMSTAPIPLTSIIPSPMAAHRHHSAYMYDEAGGTYVNDHRQTRGNYHYQAQHYPSVRHTAPAYSSDYMSHRLGGRRLSSSGVAYEQQPYQQQHHRFAPYYHPEGGRRS